MNWLAKINLNIVLQRLGPFRSALFLLIAIIICLFCGYRLGNFYHAYQAQTLNEQSTRLETLYQQQDKQQSRINTLEVELAVEHLANQRTQLLLKSMEKAHYQVKKDLAFYQKVMAPEKQADGLVIDNFIMAPTESPNHYRFNVTLVQQKLKKAYAKGYVDIVISGSLANKPSTLKLSDISTLDKKSRSFSFKYFQVIEGVINLPENFKPEKVDVSAILPKGKWQKYYRLDETYHWLALLKNDLS